MSSIIHLGLALTHELLVRNGTTLENLHQTIEDLELC